MGVETGFVRKSILDLVWYTTYRILPLNYLIIQKFIILGYSHFECEFNGQLGYYYNRIHYTRHSVSRSVYADAGP